MSIVWLLVIELEPRRCCAERPRGESRTLSITLLESAELPHKAVPANNARRQKVLL